jgi:hypothetical protein
LRAGLPLTCFLGFGPLILTFVVVFFFAMIVSSRLDPLNVIPCVPAVPRSAGRSIDLAGLVGASAGPESMRSEHPALSDHFAAGRPDGSAARCREPSPSTA